MIMYTLIGVELLLKGLVLVACQYKMYIHTYSS